MRCPAAAIIALLSVSQLSLLAQVGNLGVGANSVNFSASPGSSTNLSQTVSVSSSGAPLALTSNVVYFSSIGGWLSASLSSATTPATLTISVNAAGLQNGNYSAQVVVNGGITQSKSVTVFLSVSPTGGAGSFVANPTSVTLSAPSGTIASQFVNVIAANNSVLPFSVFTSTSNGGSWLSATANSTNTPATLSVIANANNLAVGTYSGTVTITPTGGGQGTSIPVSLNVSTGSGSSSLSVSPSSLTFNYQAGGASPAAQSVAINNTTGQVAYTAQSSVTWLSLASTSGVSTSSVTGVTGTSLTVIANPTGFAAGTYNATITISASGLSSQSVAVSLVVTGGTGTGGGTGLVASPGSIAFNYQPNGSLPQAQAVSFKLNGTAISTFTETVTSDQGWLYAQQQDPTTLTVAAPNPSNLATGNYTGSVVVSAGGSSVTIPVTLTVGTPAGTGTAPSITASPTSLTFQGQLGSTTLQQSISLTTSTGGLANFSTVASSNPSWLTVSPGFGGAPSSLTVQANLSAISTAGSYTGSITITNSSANTSQSIPVTLTVTGTSTGGGTLIATPQTLTFSQTPGGTAPPAQTIAITLKSGGATISATSNSPTWLSVTPTGGSTPATLSVTVNGASLSTGSYQGSIAVVTGSTTLTIPVTLNVTASATSLTVSPNSLTFNYQSGGTTPASQTVAVGSTGASTNFTTTAITSSGASWLSASSGASATPSNLSVSVNPAGLTPGTYSGTVTVAGSGSSQTVAVTLNITNQATPSIRLALNAASSQPGLIAPGEIITLQGTNMGPLTGVTAAVSSAGAINTTLSGVQVLFDGNPAPLLFVRNDQINAIAPYAIYGQVSTKIQVQYSGATSDPLQLRVAASAPGVFTADASGRGQGAILNQDGSVNAPGHPAPAGTVISIYATGEGQTNPAGQDGRIISSDLRKPLLPVSVMIGGVPAVVLYAGSAPGLVSGAMQVNVLIPTGLPSGPATVDLQVGNNVSPSGVTVSIQ